MKIISIQVTNFGSYKHLSLDLADIGLGLIHGKTGCGKSTVMDMAYWVLFGRTAKDGSVDEVRSWQNDGEPTAAIVRLQINNGDEIAVFRSRGAPQQNDLHFSEVKDGDVGRVVRGKDLADTQKLLNERLGVDADLYALGAYFHEFSPSASFFTDRAKERRAIFERIASMDLPVRLAEAASGERKISKSKLQALEKDLSRSQGRIETYDQSIKSAEQSGKLWEVNHSALVLSLAHKAKNFDEIKYDKISRVTAKAQEWAKQHSVRVDRLISNIEAELSACNELERQLTSHGPQSAYCPTCKQVTGEGREHLELQKEITASIRYKKQGVASLTLDLDETSAEINPYADDVDRERRAENHYAAQLEKEKDATNPFEHQLKEMMSFKALELESLKISQKNIDAMKHNILSLTQLYDLSFELRGAMLKNSVQSIETETSRILDTYFDAEIKVGLTLEGSDSLEVSIQKSGYYCVYRQLSKGQRGLLRVAFGVAVMKAASDRAGVHFDNLFLDEALDGLDTSLKLKAFSLFEELAKSHGTVLVIDHCEELKELFDKRYSVTMESDISEVHALE